MWFLLGSSAFHHIWSKDFRRSEFGGSEFGQSPLRALLSDALLPIIWCREVRIWPDDETEPLWLKLELLPPPLPWEQPPAPGAFGLAYGSATTCPDCGRTLPVTRYNGLPSKNFCRVCLAERRGR